MSQLITGEIKSVHDHNLRNILKLWLVKPSPTSPTSTSPQPPRQSIDRLLINQHTFATLMEMNFVRNIQFICWFYCCLQFGVSIHYERGVCRSVFAHNEEQLSRRLQNCSLVVGSVSLINVHFQPPLLNVNDSRALPLIEITDYLLIYRVKGLSTLHNLLPKLTLIRGSKLLFDAYALIIYENIQLERLNLRSLQRVSRGAIHITKNPLLCTDRSDLIRWQHNTNDTILVTLRVSNSLH